MKFSMSEKSMGAQRTQRPMEGFWDAVNVCGFQDLGFLGPKFTWCNMQEGSNRIYLRLEKAFANLEWLNFFKNLKVHHLIESTLDNFLLRISDSCPLAPTRKRRFHFKAMWVKKEDCKEIIETARNGGSLSNTLEGVASNLSRCVSELAAWNKKCIGNIPKKIQEKRKALNSLTTIDHDGTYGVAIEEMRREINDLLDSEEILWHQRSKIHWYREGDRNTKFFHARASNRRKKNTIWGLWDDEGRWCNDKEGISTIALA